MTIVAGTSSVQPAPLLARIRGLLRAHPGDLDTIFECRLALMLALHPDAGSQGFRAMWQVSGLGIKTMQHHLPAEGTTSVNGLIRCVFRGWSCANEQDGQRPGVYILDETYSPPNRTEADWMSFADPERDGWKDHRTWAVAVIFGPSDQNISTAEMDAACGSRKRGWVVFHRLQDKALAVKPDRGQIRLMLDRATDHFGDTQLTGTLRKECRYHAVQEEALRWHIKRRQWLRDRWMRALGACRSGRVQLARYLGFEPTEDQIIGLPDHLHPDLDVSPIDEKRRLQAQHLARILRAC
jgi:hypothetical protein